MEIIRKLKNAYIFEKIYKYVMKYKKTLLCDQIKNYKRKYVYYLFRKMTDVMVLDIWARKKFYTLHSIDGFCVVIDKEKIDYIPVNHKIKDKYYIRRCLTDSEKYIMDNIHFFSIMGIIKIIARLKEDPDKHKETLKGNNELNRIYRKNKNYQCWTNGSVILKT